MLKTALVVALALAPFAFASGAPEPSPEQGRWRAALQTPGGELPFSFELQRDGAAWRAVILNGPERIQVPVVEVEGDRFRMAIDYFDAEIAARLAPDGRSMVGAYTKRRGPTEVASVPFAAALGGGRFTPTPACTPEVHQPLAGRWRVRFASDDADAVGVFEEFGAPKAAERRAIQGVVGTFLTNTGDYRFLEGDWDGRNLRLSVFDGAHAFLFTAALQPNGSLKGDFWSGAHFHDTWTAVRDETAALDDAWSLNTADGDALAALSFPDTDGATRALNDPAFAGKARVIEVFGTWCPNCKDATDYLVELHSKYADRGLSILGLAFEVTGEPQRDRAQVKTYIDRRGVTYPVLVAGVSDKEKAGEAFPALDKVRAYPTTIFLDAQGRVRAVYTGFNGPATGEENAKLRKQWEGLIEELLAPN